MALDAYHIDSVTTCMLRQDSSEMLPGSQKGEGKTAILKPHTREAAILATQVRVTRWNMGYLWLERVMIT